MLIVSFARTTAALVAGEKSVTRRVWTDAHAAKFKPGDLFQGWSKSPRCHGRKVAICRVVSVVKELTSLAPDSDYAAEGFAYMDLHGLTVGPELTCADLWREWRDDPTREATTLRFELVSVEPGVTPEAFFPPAIRAPQESSS